MYFKSAFFKSKLRFRLPPSLVLKIPLFQLLFLFCLLELFECVINTVEILLSTLDKVLLNKHTDDQKLQCSC